MLNICLKISDNTYGINDSKYTILLIINSHNNFNKEQNNTDKNKFCMRIR